ncbi:MAG TPA: AAA family ATPase [Dermatophilaceae bacterium]|nr:AAA family ATPase [Dermatophilaceae bacterium]
MTAFGPFATTQRLDFDALGEAGLFLVHGATGAGKTSILDAVCFALYAAVPGARQSARRSLRSDHAAPDAVPKVELELTVSGRRLRVTRTPEFARPKKRGAGVLTVHATVLLEELRGGSWVGIASRMDEAALALDDALGLGLSQFTSVAMLPQGEFAAFLRAAPKDRAAVLEKLFDTGRFADVQDWLAARRRACQAGVDSARRQLEVVRLRALDALAMVPAPAPGPAVLDDGPAGELLSRLDAVLAEVTELSVARLTVSEQAAAHRDHLGRLLAEAERVLERQGTAAAARLALAALAQQVDALAEAETELDAARRAAHLAGHLQELSRARELADAAAGALLQARAVAGSGLGGGAGVGAALETMAGWDEPLAVAVDVARSLERCAAEVTRAVLEAQTATARLEVARADRVEAERAAAAIRCELDGVTAEAATLAEARRRAEEAARVVALLADVEQVEQDVAVTAMRCTQARQDFVTAEGEAVRRRAARLAGMAAELATGLVADQPCPVCGSCAHPHPAVASHLVSADDVACAEAAAAQAGDLVAVAREAQARATARRDQLAAQVQSLAPGVDGQAAAVELLVARTALAAATAADAQLPALAQQTDAARRGAMAAIQTEQAQAVAAAESQSRAAAAEAQHAQALGQLRAAVDAHAQACRCVVAGPCGGGPRRPARVNDVAARHRQVRDALTELLTAEQAAAAADRVRADREVELAAVLAEHGFAGEAEALAAQRPSATVEALVARLAEAARTRHQAEALLTQPDVLDAERRPPPDRAALHASWREARDEAVAALTQHSATEVAGRQLAGLRAAVEATVAELDPAAAELAVVAEVADCAGGTSASNRLRMPLSAYVLAARLEEVARLANERLDKMTGGRFALEHTDALAGRGARSGLGLRVRDSWTGSTRDTATLSGGESFVASLALALGLADAVRAEAGGLDLQTLFVDEGFGSLDEDSLEHVLAVLDGLREGGRTVGVVSHVAELRQRIGAQVRVERGPNGSTVATQVGAGSSAA